MNQNDINIPKPVLKAFPQLSEATFVRQMASSVPLAPDTTFDIFMTKSGASFAFVTTDYADPLSQSRELKKISGQHEFEFDHLLKPYDNNRVVEVLEHDEMDDDFFVPIDNTYFYTARLKKIK